MVKDYLDNNRIKVLLPMFAFLSFGTWILKVPQLYNIILYVVILLLMIVFKFRTFTLIMFSLFSLMGNYRAEKHQLLFQIVFGVLAIYFIGMLLYKVFIKKEKLKGKLLLPISLFLIYSIATIIWTVDVVSAISRISIIIQGYIVYLAVVNSDDKIEFSEVSWFFSLVLLVLSSQYITIISQTGVYFNFDNKHALMELWANPNVVAAIFGITWLPSLYKYFVNKKSKYVFGYLPIELLVVYSIYATQSKGLYFGVLVMLVMIPILFFIKNKKVIISGLFAVTIGFGFLMILLVLFKESYPEIFNKVNHFSTSRLQIYEIGINQFKNPLVILYGKGIGSTHPVLIQNGFSNFYYHSWFFEIWVNQGLVGLVLTYINFCLVFKILTNSKDKFIFFASFGIIAYLFHSLIDMGYEYQFLGVYYYLLISIVEKNNKNKQEVGIIHEEKNNITS